MRYVVPSLQPVFTCRGSCDFTTVLSGLHKKTIVNKVKVLLALVGSPWHGAGDEEFSGSDEILARGARSYTTCSDLQRRGGTDLLVLVPCPLG